jgi:plastocyanin
VKHAAAALGLVAILLVLGACSSGVAAPVPSGPPASVDPNAVRISARDLKFSTAQLSAPADKAFSIVFDNQESAPHNVAIYRDESASQKILVEDPFGGPKVVTYQVGPLGAGSYFFRCDVHPEMKGTLTVK